MLQGVTGEIRRRVAAGGRSHSRHPTTCLTGDVCQARELTIAVAVAKHIPGDSARVPTQTRRGRWVCATSRSRTPRRAC